MNLSPYFITDRKQDKAMKNQIRSISPMIFVLLLFVSSIIGQDFGNKASSDNNLRGSGRVNPSTLGMEFNIPLGSYAGRGIDVPISLSYSSKLWRSEYLSRTPIPGTSGSVCYNHYSMNFAEKTASGWTSSVAVPYIEYIGSETFYTEAGLPSSTDDPGCLIEGGEPPQFLYFAKRILVHLPSGETHELRASDTLIGFYVGNGDEYEIGPWNATYYAVDGSNIKYIQNSSSGIYKLLMPDGSYYDFHTGGGIQGERYANKYTDRNGNKTEFFGPGSVDPNSVTHANGYWKDTFGRIISVPLGLEAPTSPTTDGSPQEYSMPGMTESYKLHWKSLKGASASESALTNFTDDLKYPGGTYGCLNGLGWPTYCNRSSGEYLFDSNGAIILSDNLFNPVVLTKIELPNGGIYKFTYDVYGRIEQIHYPTGGEEHFTYSVIPTLSRLDSDDEVGGITNFGVISRELLKSSSDTAPYVWEYEADYVEPGGYAVRVENPDGTKTERFLHRGNPSCSACDHGTFGYDNGLAGMAYEERSFDNAGTLLTRKLTSWDQEQLSILLDNGSFTFNSTKFADWHPRITHVETLTYSPSGNGDFLSSLVRYEYEGDLSQRDSPVLVNKTSQYAFTASAGSNPLLPELPGPGEPPDPEPTPIPTPSPSSSPAKMVETQYLISDTAYAGVKSYYTAQNMIGLVTATTVKDGAGTIVSRSEIVYDDTTNYPLLTPGSPSQWNAPANGYRGNPNTLRVWDSTKGNWDNSGAYISTHAQFDTYGNQVKAWDAKGNFTTTTFDTTYYAFPLQVTTPVPDSGGTHGSSSSFVTTSTFDTVTGLPLTTTDANGLKTQIEYDDETLRPLNTKTFYNDVQVGTTVETIYHDEPGNYWVKNRSKIDATNWAESITYYDGLGRAYKTERVHSEGNIFVEKEFDAEGRPKRVTNPYRTGETKQWTTNIYDDASRVIEVELPDGAKIKTDYGVSVTGTIGITKQITDQAGKKRKGITDGLGRMIQVIEDPSGTPLTTDYVFDTLGNLRKTIQGEQNRFFMHDSLGRLLYAKQPEQEVNTAFTATDPITSNTGWSAKYEYDDNGNITKTTDAEGVYVEGTYDGLNRLKVRNYSDSTPDVSFYYDGKGLPSVPARSNGKTTKVTSSISENRYTNFDDMGRLLTHRQSTDGRDFDTSYTYNLSGALIEETYPSGRKVKHVLDNDGELSIVQSAKCLDGTPGTNAACTSQAGVWNYASSFTYNTVGAVTKMQLGNGRWETAQYNSRQQITQIGLGTTDSTQNLLKLELGYGNNTQNNGALREQKITVPTVGGSAGFTAIQTYAYDDLNRIQSATEEIEEEETWKQTFQYDRYGNRRFNTTSSLTTTLGSCTEAICNPEVSTATNRLTTAGYEYDKNGNLTEDTEGRQFIYDAENHQTEVKDNLDNTIGEYLYDGEGKRVKKISTTETTIFVYNASGQLVAEYSTEVSTTPQVSYLTTDHLGSPRVITDQGGNVTTRKDYTAFGEENISAERVSGLGYSGSGEETRKGYTGYEKDGESGLDFAQARYYNSTHGRFTSIDPLTASMNTRNPQTLNRYSYVLNSPYKYTDPLGLLPSSANYTGCSAEFSSCDGLDNTPSSVREALQQYEARLRNSHDRNRAQAAANRGDHDRMWDIIRSNPTLSAYQNGQIMQDPNEPEVTVEATVNPPGVNDALTMSQAGINLLKSYEGKVDGSGEPVLSSYSNDGSSSGNCTIGWGHLLNSGSCSGGNRGKTITRQDAESIFAADLAKHEGNVKKKIGVKLTQNEFDALVILDFNYGIGSASTPKLLKALNTLGTKNPNLTGIVKEWSNILGAPGLAARRHDELEVFFFNQYGRGKDK